MATPYRDASADTRPGLADEDPSAKGQKWFWGCMVGLFLFLLLPGAALVVVGAVLMADGDDSGVVMLGVGAGMPCMLAFIFVFAFGLAILRRTMAGGAGGGVLVEMQRQLGGDLQASPWKIGATPTLRTHIDGQKATFTAYMLPPRTAQSALLMSFVETGMRTGATELFRGLRVRLAMLTNQRSRLKISLVNRSRLSGLGADLAGLQEVHLPPEIQARIACYASDAAHATHLLAQPGVLDAVVEIMESNAPYITQLGFSPEGTRWSSLATSKTTPEHMVWRFQKIGGITDKL